VSKHVGEECDSLSTDYALVGHCTK
jgi:hypothetical protein